MVALVVVRFVPMLAVAQAQPRTSARWVGLVVQEGCAMNMSEV
jgi:hypothetical protein